MKKMKIEIWSDIACPYCYIGKRKMEQALDRHPHKEAIELEWHSYELNPALPKGSAGRSYYECLAEQLNVTEQLAQEAMKPLIDEAKNVGIDFDFDKLIITSTSDALRFVKLAKKYDKSTDAEELLFKAYFSDGKCISDRTFLTDTARQLQIPQLEVERMLDSDDYLEEIAKDIAYSENVLKLEYIPFYRFNMKAIIQGAIESDEYMDVLIDTYNDWVENGISSTPDEVINGQACSIDGVCG